MPQAALLTIVVLLAAAVIAVPIARRLGIGSVLGYLAAGIAIGPVGLGLVTDVESIRHASELGIVMLLFLIGIELRPARLWLMRRAVFVLGGAQVLGTAAALTGLGLAYGLAPPTAVLVGSGLALSSTALVLPMLSERKLLGSAAGRDSFGILLFQDLAIIPMVALLPMLFAGLEPRSPAAIVQGVLVAGVSLLMIFFGGRYLIRPMFQIVDAAKAREIFTAAALLVVVGTAALADAAGLSMSLGAFLAGVLLADSEYRHELRADLEPFEGLLLGLFFIAIGMSMDVGPLLENPGGILAVVATIIAVKAALIYGLARLFRHDRGSALRMALALAQGGEFAFILFGFAAEAGLLPETQAQLFMLVVILSMIATPLLFAAAERWAMPRLVVEKVRPFEPMVDEGSPVIICGFGRVGQVVGRVLRIRQIPFTALETDASQVEIIRRYGNKVYYGDPSRAEVLRAAGADRARVLVVALEDMARSVAVIETARRHFPNLTILARARNRRHAHRLMDLGVRRIVRETFHSSLVLTEFTLRELGWDPKEIERTISTFREHDKRTLIQQHPIYQDETRLIQSTRQAAEELKALLQSDQPPKE